MEPVRKTTYDLHRSTGEREQGLSAEEVERRIRSGQVGTNDLLAVLGGAPKPFWHFPRFADLPIPESSGSAPAQAAPASVPRVAAFEPRPAASSVAAVPRPSGPSGPAAGLPSGPLHAGVPAGRTLPPTRGASGSGSRTVQPAPSAVVRVLEAPEVAAAPPAAGALPWRAPRPFPDALMRLRPQALRARLLEATLQEVVGCGEAELPDYALACARARLSQIEALMKPRWFEPAEVAAVTEVMGLVSQGCTLLAFPNLKEKLQQRQAALGRPAVLRELTALALPMDDALEQVSGKSRSERATASVIAADKRGAMSMITGAVMSVVGGGSQPSNSLSVPPAVFYARLTEMRIDDAVGVLPTDGAERIAACARERLRQVEKNVAPLAQSSEERELLHQIRCRLAQCAVVLSHPELSRVLRQRQARMGRSLTVGETVDLSPSPADALAVLSAPVLKEALATLTASAILSRSNAASEERLRELEQLMSAPPDLATEPLQWGTGDDEDEGARIILLPLAALLLAGVALAFFLPTGVNELLPELDRSIHYGRAIALALAAYFAVRGVRFEAFSRFGWQPIQRWQWAFALVGGLAGGVMGAVFKGDPNASFGLVPVLVLSLLRGVSEAFFFEGLVARTLLLDAEQPAKAIVVAGSMSAIYTGLLVQASTGDMQMASVTTVLWWLLVALPSSAIMWQTRAVSVVMLFRTLAWVAFYLSW